MSTCVTTARCGFRLGSYLLEKKVDAKALLMMERDEMIDTVIASHSSKGSRRSPVLIPVPDEAAYEYLVARNVNNEGIYLVWHGAGSNTDLTEEVYEDITEEADAAGLAPTYHVYSRRNLIVTDDVVWYQIPGGRCVKMPEQMWGWDPR